MKLEDEIEHLNQMLVKMAQEVIENLKICFELYNKFDNKKADYINDDVVDLHERLIEEMCLNIMLKERPYAKDLRKVSGILKLVNDLERLGDHAQDIKDFAYKLSKFEHYSNDKIDRAILLTMEMVSDSIKAYINKDITLANDVIKRDDIIDSLYEEILLAIIKMANEKQCSDIAVYTTLIAKYIERIADHAVNVAEWVIYIISGYYKDKQIF